MFGILLFIHIVVCVALILVVLLQAGKGGGLAGAFGAAGGQTGQMLFGGRGAATFLSKATAILGSAFLVTSLILGIMQSRVSGPRSVLEDVLEPGMVSPASDAPPPSAEGFAIPTPDDAAPAPGTPDAGSAPAGTPDAAGSAEPSTGETTPPASDDGGN